MLMRPDATPRVALPCKKRILQRMRQKVRSLDYVATAHAEEEMSDDDLTVLDVENAILSGRIRERQRRFQDPRLEMRNRRADRGR